MRRMLLLPLLALAACGPSDPAPASRVRPPEPVVVAAPEFAPRRTPAANVVEGPIRRGPYIQAVTTSEAVVCFETSRETEGTVACDGKTLSSPGGKRHEVALKGLKPGTRYAYTVQPGGIEGSFKTAPAEGDADLFFLAWGDCRTY